MQLQGRTNHIQSNKREKGGRRKYVSRWRQKSRFPLHCRVRARFFSSLVQFLPAIIILGSTGRPNIISAMSTSWHLRSLGQDQMLFRLHIDWITLQSSLSARLYERPTRPLYVMGVRTSASSPYFPFRWKRGRFRRSALFYTASPSSRCN